MDNFILTKNDLKTITENLIITKHAKQRIKERLGEKDITEIKQMLIKPLYAWRNTDNTFAIAPNNEICFVVSKQPNGYVLITVKEKSKNEIPMSKKFTMAFFGHKPKGKENKNDNTISKTIKPRR